MIFAHGEVVINFWLTVFLLVFGLPFLFFVLYRKKPYALPIAFATICIGVSILSLYLMFVPR